MINQRFPPTHNQRVEKIHYNRYSAVMEWFWNTLEVILLIVIPLFWGLGVEYLFEWYRRRSASYAGNAFDRGAYDSSVNRHQFRYCSFQFNCRYDNLRQERSGESLDCDAAVAWQFNWRAGRRPGIAQTACRAYQEMLFHPGSSDGGSDRV